MEGKTGIFRADFTFTVMKQVMVLSQAQTIQVFIRETQNVITSFKEKKMNTLNCTLRISTLMEFNRKLL